jgi:hypothetical protein
MTPLRKQLQQAREEYLAARYPGDLASELLPPARSRNWRIVGLIATGAIAASIIVFVSLHAMKPTKPIQLAGRPMTTPAASQDVGFAAPSIAITPNSVDAIPSMPMTPSAMDLSLPSMDLSMPAMPSLPAWDEPSTTPKKTQEAI